MTQQQFADQFCKSANRIKTSKHHAGFTEYRRNAQLVGVWHPTTGMGTIMGSGEQRFDHIQVCGEPLPWLTQLAR